MSGFRLPEEIQALMLDMERMRQERETREAQANPEKHQLSRLMPPGVSASYRYYAERKHKGRQHVRYCYASHPNVAGYFLTWREVETDKELRRDNFEAWGRRKDAAQIAKR